jgi:toxin ParE1/3/4
MKFDYYFSEAALQDIGSINDYLFEEYAPKLADQFLDALLRKCDRLVQFPEMGRKRDEFSINLRSFPFQKYLIFYRIALDEIEIVRVVSGYQDLSALFEED